MSILIWSILATLLVSLISLIGIVCLWLKEQMLRKILLFLVAFSAGTLMSGAFLHLIPEALETTVAGNVFIFTLIGFSFFFLIERILHWHHCHKSGGGCAVHTLSQMNLIGDGIHNFIDGLVIASSFVVSIPLGMATTIAVISHEIPQEISDFGVLVYGGYSKKKALLFNVLSALLAVAGAIIAVYLAGEVSWFTAFLLPFTAGGFIYIAASDLIPELHKDPEIKRSIASLFFFFLGIIFMVVMGRLFVE